MSHHFVLVTGISGYVGAHVAKAFLARGHKVRGTVRSASQADHLKQKYSEFKDKFEVVVVPDLTTPHSLDDALHGVDALVHVASPFAYHFKDPKTEILDVAITATKNALESAAKSPSVKRVVVTSSFAAIVDASLGPARDHTYTEKDWNPVTYESALQINNPVVYYLASKKLAEQAVYEFVEKTKPHFDVVTINPPMIFGPLEHDFTISSLNESIKQFWDIVTEQTETLPETRVPAFADVRDVALAHVLAVENPKAAGRYLIATGSYYWQELFDIVHKHFPARKIVPVGKPGDYPKTYRVDHSKAEKELGIHFIPFEKTVVDTLEQLFAQQDHEAKK